MEMIKLIKALKNNFSIREEAVKGYLCFGKPDFSLTIFGEF